MAYHQKVLATVKAGIAAPRLMPELLALHQPVRLAPEEHLPQVAEIPAVADNAVLGTAACPVR